MDCPLKSGNGIELFISRSAGALSSETEAALSQHVDKCEECRRAAEVQRRLWSTLDAWTPTPVSHNFDDKLFAKIAAEEQKPVWRTLADAGVLRTWAWKPAMPIAAACIAIVAALLVNNTGPEHRMQLSVQPQSVQNQSLQDQSLREKIDIEQVERALDDVDMLKQLGLASVPPQVKASRPATI